MTASARDLPDVVLVVLDTARRDRFGCYGYPRPTSPCVDRLADNGIVAETMISNAPWTLPSHGSLFTGLYPSEHGIQWRSGFSLRPSVPLTMAEALRRLGYDTWCVTNNPLITRTTGLVRGFDHYAVRERTESRVGRITRHARRIAVGADSGGRVMNRWIGANVHASASPIFLFVNYLETHWPWSAPFALRRRVRGPRRFPWRQAVRYRLAVARANPEAPWSLIPRADLATREALSAQYDAEVADADAQVEQLLSLLDASRGRRPRVVVVTADHGEQLGEGGLADHHGSLADVLIRVPFVAAGDGVPTGRVGGTFEFVDVLPSLLTTFDQPVPEHLDGRRTGLFEARHDGRAVAFAEWRSWPDHGFESLSRKTPGFDFHPLRRDLVCARDERWKLVRTSRGEELLFDLAHDAEERTDRAAEQREDVERLGRALDGAIERWRRWEGERADVSAAEEREIEQRLADLGYI